MKKNICKGFSMALLVCIMSCNTHEKPNIIWLVSEDQSPEFFPMYGDDTANLPHLEALAEDSVIYDNMHATTPVCAPARSAIITGMYPTTLGTHNMRTYNEGRDTNQPELGIPNYSPKFSADIKPFTTYLREAGYYCTNNNKQDYNFRISKDAWDQTCRYCQGEEKANIHWRNRAEGQPFFAVFNFQITHESQIWKQQNSKRHVTPDEVKNIPPYFPDDPVIREDMATNYSNLVRMDNEIGKLIAELKAQGLYENSYIFFYSDHGGPFPRHKRAIYDSGIRVPLMIKLPKSEKAGTRNDDLWSFVDLAPTVLDLAKITLPSYLQGKSILNNKTKAREYLVAAADRFDGQVDRIRAIKNKRFKLIRNYNVSLPHALDVNYRKQVPMMRRLMELNDKDLLNANQKRWFQTPKSPIEFYDLLTDPFELHNLASDSSYTTEIRAFERRLDAWIKTTNDLGELPESEIIKYSTQ
ncbi:MAG: Arylsulfatase [Bacteroidota bacterium]|nr:MAG: Arylsulfatase [Bacteroidota bacterium]